MPRLRYQQAMHRLGLGVPQPFGPPSLPAPGAPHMSLLPRRIHRQAVDPAWAEGNRVS